MKSIGINNPCTKKSVSVKKTRIACPAPNEDIEFAHPRVYLTPPAVCPYCGTKYQLKKGSKNETH